MEHGKIILQKGKLLELVPGKGRGSGSIWIRNNTEISINEIKWMDLKIPTTLQSSAIE